MNPDLLEQLPPPPPWRKECLETSGEVLFVNEVTGEERKSHPLSEYLGKRFPSREDTSAKNENKNKDNNNENKTDNEKEKENTSGSNAPLDEEMERMCDSLVERTEDFCGGNHWDFRCEWKEIGLMGNILSFGITLKYFLEDKHFELVFDGVDAVWKYSKLDGVFGPLDEFDLFIGSKITIFGRHLSITSTNCDICRRIDKKEAVLRKQIAYLQGKVEMLGVNPVVRRASQDPIKSIARSTSKTGHGNLRRLRNDLMKLREQMGDLGLGHLLKNV